MREQIVECVPNFSEGREKETIEAIAEAVKAHHGVKLLDCDPDADYNRVVVTFAGAPEAVLEALLAASDEAIQRIDMRQHKGGHPRMGAVDVVPFVPVRHIGLHECTKLAERYGKMLAERHGLPVYLYEESAKSPERKSLANIRKGQYEALEAKLKDPKWAPDFGEAVFNEKAGATVTGARKFLIAYNVNLATKELSIANEIALTLRESGRLMRNQAGEKVLDETGKPMRIAGRLKAVKGIGVALPEKGITQVSMNLTDYHRTPMHEAFKQCKKEAAKHGVAVTGSEVVGVLPMEALLMAADDYGTSETLSEAEKARLAAEKLGLSDLAPFVLEKKVIEWMV